MIPEAPCPGLQDMLTMDPTVASVLGKSTAPNLKPRRQRRRLSLEVPRPCPIPPTSTPISCVTLDKLLNFSEPLFPSLQAGDLL